MEFPPSVKEFSEALCLLSAPEIGLTDDMTQVYKCLVCPTNMIAIVPTMRQFCSAFFDEVKDHIEPYVEQFIESEVSFLEFMIPRCLILCDTSEPFYFILTCGFIVEVIYHMFGQLGCYRFVMTASKCIRAIIERRYKFFFEDVNQWRLLCSYSEKIMDEFYSSEKKVCIVDFVLSKGKHKDYMINLINKCLTTRHAKFVLSKYELALLDEEDTVEIEPEENTKRMNTEECLKNLPETYDSFLVSVRNNENLSVKSAQHLPEHSSPKTVSVSNLHRNNKSSAIYKKRKLEFSSVQSCSNQLRFEVNHEEYKWIEQLAESLEQDPVQYLYGPTFQTLHDRVCNTCELKCFKFLVLCVEKHLKRYGDDVNISEAYLVLHSDE